MKILSIDAETNGLYGNAFIISAVLINEDGQVAEIFCGRCPIDEEVDSFVKDNVLPQVEGIKVTNDSYESLLKDFIEYYKSKKDDAIILVHMGCPVEAKLFIDAQRMGFMGTFDGPYPLTDISAYPEISDSVDTYAEKHKLMDEINEILIELDIKGGTHNPVYDCIVTAKCYLHWLLYYHCTVNTKTYLDDIL